MPQHVPDSADTKAVTVHDESPLWFGVERHKSPTKTGQIFRKKVDIKSGCGIWLIFDDDHTGQNSHHHKMPIKEGNMANFLFVLSKDDNESATRCFQFAKIAYDKGHKVNMFFIDDGVAWADKARDLTSKTTTGDCPNDYLPYLVEKEVETGICTPCAKNRQLDEAGFFTNMQLDGGPHLIDMAAEAKVFNF